ncbi:NB-ARC domain-containing protein [Calothrix sp. PCC 7716]|nr:NB-ARC domain-containing protein [Calothrix sp. PCC 7716]
MYQENKDGATGFQTQNNGGTVNNTVNKYYASKETIKAVKHIPYTGAKHFVGRNEELATIHEKLHSSNTLIIFAIAGMGGVGKTELAIKYVRRYENYYPGGICWFSVRESNIAAEIITFAKNYLKLEVPHKDSQEQSLTLKQQVGWCWSKWHPPLGLVLIVFDDVTTLDNFREYLPTDNRFRVLITTRLRNIDTNIDKISLDVLSLDEALKLLINLIGENQVNKELEIAQKLCKWLGYLPLGIELVGRYINKKPPYFTLARMLEQLKEQRLQQEAINVHQATLSTAQRGVKAAFELSWLELNSTIQQVAALLSLFASEIFAYEWVESTTRYLNWNDDDVNVAVQELYRCHSVDIIENNNTYYNIHPLIREFLQAKLATYLEANKLRQAFVNTFIKISQSIPNCPTLELINSVKSAIPHLTEVAQNLTDVVNDKDLCLAFEGLARFYAGQGLYTLAEPWYQQCASAVQSRLGESHPDYALSLNNLANLYHSQGKYDKAEPLYTQALELYKRILGENHPDYALSLNNLANLYYSQGKYDKAEPLYTQALELYKRILGENYPDYVLNLNNLAFVCDSQGKHDKAEPLYTQALELREQILGENHPDYALSLNNLATLYYSQGKYDKAEPLYTQALELREQILGENHPDYALSLNNLATLYYSQGKYDKAEPLYTQALELRERILGENHPDYALSLSNLANLYYSQRKYDKAERLYTQALELTRRMLGENHPYYALSLSNLAFLYRSQRKYGKAEPLYTQALELRKRILGENHPDYASSLNNLANLYYSQGKYEKSEPMYILALKIAELSLGANHPNTISYRKSLELLQNNLCYKVKKFFR